LVARYENIEVDSIRLSTGWPLAIAETVGVIPPPSAKELRALRGLHARTRIAHARPTGRSKKQQVAAP
jgi:glutaconate CoA-transferase subunit B